MANKKFIPIAIPDLSSLEKEYLNDAFDSTWISSKGKYIDKLEDTFADICEVKHCIAVSNGTVALHLALLALNIGPGDEVIIPSLTYIATANAVKYVGATPIFVDVDRENWCIDPKMIENAITKKTKCIITVNLYGHPADADSINKIAKKHKLFVIEDAAESHMAQYKGKPTGGLADIGVFSFYGNKIFTSGEGGALTLNNDIIAKKIRLLKGQGMDLNRQYFFPIIGYNYRMTNIAASILVAQLERRNEILSKRHDVFAKYDKLLKNIDGISLQPKDDFVEVAPWFYSVLIDEKKYGMSRDELIKLLKMHKVETRPFFIPIHELPPYIEEYDNNGKNAMINTIILSKSGINLPTHFELTDKDINMITSIIRNKK